MSLLRRIVKWLQALRHASRTRHTVDTHTVALAQLGQAIEALARKLEMLSQQASTLVTRTEFAENFAAHAQRIQSTRESVDRQATELDLHSRALQDLVERETTIAEAQRILRVEHDDLARRMKALHPSIPALARAAGTHPGAWLDHAFAETFRGTSEQIRQRLSVYLPDVDAAVRGCDGAPVIDVGCGRGDWLELLRERGIANFGIEQNTAVAEFARARGLDVRIGDCVTLLDAEAAGSLSTVTVFHVIEHLSLAQQLRLLVSVHRALAPEGILIMETPNPENLAVGAWTFYLDPTHLRPLPPALLRFLLEASGFEVVDTRRLHPDPEIAARAERESWPAGVRDFLCAPRDYAMLARHASA